jgi:hypothetical protein
VLEDLVLKEAAARGHDDHETTALEMQQSLWEAAAAAAA